MSKPALSDDDRATVIGMLGVPKEQARLELAARSARLTQSREAFRKLTTADAAPMVACFRAVAAGYTNIDIETLMLVAWICFRWEREGQIPSGDPHPTIILHERARTT